MAGSGFSPSSVPGLAGFNFASIGFTGDPQPYNRHFNQTEATPKGGAYLRTLSPSERPMPADAAGDVISWGSEVEMPQPGDPVPPPRAPPTINIQAPTESQVGKSQRAVTPSATAHGGQRTPRLADNETPLETVVGKTSTALPDPKERDLPPPPSESIRSNAPTPIPKSAPRKASTRGPGTDLMPSPPQFDDRRSQTEDKTAYQESPSRAQSSHRDMLHIIDSINPTMQDPAPWDLVTQRLYSWALLWEENSFVRALENISLSKQASRSDMGKRMLIWARSRSFRLPSLS